jgi:type IV fimbrial biogenesis protein FimT
VLNPRRPQSGFTLIELMTVIALIGILVIIAVPSFGTWTADSRVRAASEALVNALRLTQGTAVARSRVGVFALTNATPGYSAVAATNGNNWSGFLLPLLGTDETAAGMGTIVLAKAATQYSTTLTGPAAVCFNALGQLAPQTAATTGLGAAGVCTTNTDGSPMVYQVSSTKATRKFKVLVYPAGRVRMCDALKTLSTSNPDGCP